MAEESDRGTSATRAKLNVVDLHLDVDPWTREPRGFGYVMMASVKDDMSALGIYHLDCSVLESCLIAIEKVGTIRLIQIINQEDKDDKIIAICSKDLKYKHLSYIKEHPMMFMERKLK